MVSNTVLCASLQQSVSFINNYFYRLQEGKQKGVKINLEEELALLSRTTYPLSTLLQRPLPDGVDPTKLEIYLSNDEFYDLLSMTKTEFQQLPVWKQSAVKKEKGLF